MQNDVSNVLPKKAPTSDIFPEPFKNIEGKGEMQNDVFNIQPKKAPLQILAEEIRNESSKNKC